MVAYKSTQIWTIHINIKVNSTKKFIENLFTIKNADRNFVTYMPRNC